MGWTQANDLKGKQLLIFNYFKNLIEADKFDEYDVLAFLIYIRGILDRLDNNYPFIQDFCDWIAHPIRNQGIACNAISTAINNAYEETENGKIKDYHGISEDKLIRQWMRLLNDMSICVSTKTVRHIIICTFSLVQDTSLQISNNVCADVELIIAKSEQAVSLNTHERETNKPTVIFAQIHGVNTDTDIVTKAIQVRRDVDGQLTIQDQDCNVLATCK